MIDPPMIDPPEKPGPSGPGPLPVQSTIELPYESAAPEPIGRRPQWVWIVIVIYLLLIAAVLLLPLWVSLDSPGDQGLLTASTIAACVVALLGLALVFTPVRVGRRGRMTRASIWFPILASGFLLGSLVTAAGWALVELCKANDPWAMGILIGGGVVWIGWSILIWFMSSSRDPTSLAMRLHHWVFGGSVAELLIAVPAHIVVRRRNECCAGFMTGTAICVGCVTMLLSFGPSVAFLYYKRWKRIRNG